MMRRLALIVVAAALAACGGGASGPPSRRQCVELVAHHWMLSDLEGLGLGGEPAAAVGKELAARRFDDEKQAMTAIQMAELGAGPDAKPGEGERRIARCLAERSRANIECALRAATLAELTKCPP